MKTIRIPCDAVVIGDVLPATGMYPRRVVYGFNERNARVISPKTIDANETVGVTYQPRAPTPIEQWSPDMSIEVETMVELTPAQQHADEMLALVRRFLAAKAPSEQEWLRNNDGRDLLDKIDPPQPPTLDETLAQLLAVQHAQRPSDEMHRVAELLDRARRSGVLK